MSTVRVPMPGMGQPTVVAPAPGNGPGYWAGGSCAVRDQDGSYVLAYRVRNGHDGNDQNVVARSADGENFTTVVTLEREQFGAQWMERPALVRTADGWRMFVCCGSPETKKWWIDVIEADTLEGLATATPRPAFPGDELNGVKDPIVKVIDGRWHAWICCHLMDIPGEEDRMNTSYATSDDGWNWAWHGAVIEGRKGEWDSRGARVTSVLDDGTITYDGRASAAENWFERTGVAHAASLAGPFDALDTEPVDVRYLDILPLGDQAYRIYYEARLADESHELRTELVRL